MHTCHGEVAADAEKKKSNKYGHLGPAHIFMPVAIETLGAFGPRTLAFIKELGRRIWKATREEKASGFLLQRLSVAVQRGNAVAVMGTCLSPRTFIPCSFIYPLFLLLIFLPCL